jgi:predicted CxxxxCH...CXXCH cytochrome family protein
VHPDNTACVTCHETVNADFSFAYPDLHIDGVLQVSGGGHPDGWESPEQHGAAFNADGPGACTSCHGEMLDGGSSGASCETCHSNWQDDCTFCHGGVDNATGAPPVGVGGETDRGVLVVGAHTSHVEATSMHAAWGCHTCHTVPTSALSAGHIDGDGAAEVDFDALNPSGTYNRTTGACATMYCHGNGQSSGAAPDWDTDPTLDCASCHDDITQVQLDLELSGEHKKHLEVTGVTCNICHADTVAGSSTIVGPEVHVDGTIQVAFGGAFGMTRDGDSCSGTCHGVVHNNWTW